MSISAVCVCGAGTMGRGIAQASAQAGIETILYDIDATMLQVAEKTIKNQLDTLVKKQKITAGEKEKITDRIQFSADIQSCKADIIIEAIIEKPEPKVNLFNQLAAINNSQTVFATNTSSLSVTSIAAKIDHPERVVGMHFFNPPTIMKLVEIVKTSITSEDAIQSARSLALLMKKTPVLCKDAPGFIVNRVARPYYIESLRLLEENKCDIETLDALMESSGFKMGPFRLMDLIGNDVNYAVSSSLYEQLQHPLRLKPSFIQDQKVKEGKLGKKSGAGYYNYE
jgi:3-hydroxybutyryl-CoA dehydrogenase